MRVLRTKYPHVRNADGSRRQVYCPGYLNVVTRTEGVTVECPECGEGYCFRFVFTHLPEAAE